MNVSFTSYLPKYFSVHIDITYGYINLICIVWTKFKMPATSEVWTYFTRAVDKKSATCKVCNVSLTYVGTTTNLWNHVKGKHPNTKGESDKHSMKKFTVSSSRSGLNSEEITKKIVNMVVKCKPV